MRGTYQAHSAACRICGPAAAMVMQKLAVSSRGIFSIGPVVEKESGSGLLPSQLTDVRHTDSAAADGT